MTGVETIQPGSFGTLDIILEDRKLANGSACVNEHLSLKSTISLSFALARLDLETLNQCCPSHGCSLL